MNESAACLVRINRDLVLEITPAEFANSRAVELSGVLLMDQPERDLALVSLDVMRDARKLEWPCLLPRAYVRMTQLPPQRPACRVRSASGTAYVAAAVYGRGRFSLPQWLADRLHELTTARLRQLGRERRAAEEEERRRKRELEQITLAARKAARSQRQRRSKIAEPGLSRQLPGL